MTTTTTTKATTKQNDAAWRRAERDARATRTTTRIADGCKVCGRAWNTTGAEGQCGGCKRCLGCCALGKPGTCTPRAVARESKMTHDALIRRRSAQHRYTTHGGRDVFTPKAK
jgi:hypothetical protein